MNEDPTGSNYGFGRGKCAVVELKDVDGCAERRRLRSVDGERRTNEEACLEHTHCLCSGPASQVYEEMER